LHLGVEKSLKSTATHLITLTVVLGNKTIDTTQSTLRP